MGKLQHRTPQRDPHPVKLAVPESDGVAIFRGERRLTCATCGQPAVRVSKNDGPESLKGLLRL
jgi:hypothetical protein